MVSLIIPCYNAGNYIERCLNSVLNQTCLDIELILVNDGSTDSTDSIIQKRKDEIASRLNRFIYLKQKNQGVGAACNFGFKHATGKYLLLLDSDDALAPDSIQEQSNWLDSHPDYDIVRTNGYYVDEINYMIQGPLEQVCDRAKHPPLFEELFDGKIYLWPGTYMLRMSALDTIYPDREIYPSRSGQNLQFLMMASYFGKDGFIDKPLMMYTVRSESLSHFSSGDTLKKEIRAMYGYKDIRAHLIEQFLNSKEKDYWKNRLELVYLRVFMHLGIKYHDKELMTDSYLKAKSMAGKQEKLNLAIDYYGEVNAPAYYLLRLLRKSQTIIRHMGRGKR